MQKPEKKWSSLCRKPARSTNPVSGKEGGKKCGRRCACNSALWLLFAAARCCLLLFAAVLALPSAHFVAFNVPFGLWQQQAEKARQILEIKKANAAQRERDKKARDEARRRQAEAKRFAISAFLT